MNKDYEIFEHAVDIGVRVTGRDLKELFQNAGIALFEISSRKQFTKDKKHTKVAVKQKAGSLEELFVNWLNELISLSAINGLIFYDIKVGKLDKNELEASCAGSSVTNYKVNIEIKSATYRGLKIEERDSGLMAEVIFAL